MKSKDPQFLEFSEFEDVEETLEHVAALASETSFQPKRLKWVVLATHNALQGACVCYLTRSDNLGALDKKSQEKSMQYYYGGNEDRLDSPPRERLADLATLLDRMPDRFGAKIPYKLEYCETARQKNLFRLHYLRNGFVHFLPQFLMVEELMVRNAAVEALNLVSEISVSDDFANWNRFNKEFVQEKIDKATGCLVRTGPYEGK